MFERQIAVMKGQAWNVVETLKTPDHGPLELTRRAKVCVWDDLVDVPIAVPMRGASEEMRRRAHAGDYFAARTDTNIEEEEMDIGASATSQPPIDLLGATSPVADLPHPGRFELTVSDPAVTDSPEEPSSPDRQRGSSQRQRPSMGRGGSSYSGAPRSLNMYTPQHERRYSFATARTRRNSNTIAQQLYGHQRRSSDVFSSRDDDVDGDLGFAAAEGMEGNRRKVIVERLEMVKAKNPVFTWC